MLKIKNKRRSRWDESHVEKDWKDNIFCFLEENPSVKHERSPNGKCPSCFSVVFHVPLLPLSWDDLVDLEKKIQQRVVNSFEKWVDFALSQYNK